MNILIIASTPFIFVGAFVLAWCLTEEKPPAELFEELRNRLHSKAYKNYFEIEED